MTIAIDAQGRVVRATDPDAPPQANCPHCGRPVYLHREYAHFYQRLLPEKPAPRAVAYCHYEPDSSLPVDCPLYAAQEKSR
jgi:hypothetical protein